MARTHKQKPDSAQAARAAGPLPRYQQMLAENRLTLDYSQQHAATALQALFDSITTSTEPRNRLRRLLAADSKLSAGLYLWGDVGRGKSMLMDLFVEALRNDRLTCRVHFHAFMLDVHKRLHALRGLDSSGDLLPTLIRELSSEIRVLCLDELQVTDVTDAMILARLFSGLMDAGVTVVFTSNRPPSELYQSGLQRDQFLKFVALVKERLTIVEIKSPTDYRLQQLRANHCTYQFPRDAAADDFLMQHWQRLTHGAASEPLTLEVQGRTLIIEKHYHGVAWLTFGELCVRPLGAADYLTLARICHTVLLQGIPALTVEYRNEAKRLVTLIDALYDHRVKLIATAETAPEAIYPNGDGSFEFARTVSRLIEMQGQAYWGLAHIA